MKRLHSLAFLVILLGTNVKSIELVPREGQDCALLSNKIYCFGGYMVGNPNDDALNSLDIYKNNGGLTQNLNSQWEVVTPAPTNLVIGRRGFPQAVAAPDGERLLIQGGYNYDGVGKPIAQQTIAYNSKTNSWETYANYNDIKNGGDRQIYYGSGEYIPSMNAFGFYGGYQLHAVDKSDFITPDNRVLSGLTFNNSADYVSSYAGFYYFTLFDMKTNTWTIPPQTNVPRDYHISFSATYHPGSKKVFYTGGNYYNTTSASVYSSYLSYTTTFNTVNGEWLEEPINGDPPSQRKQHTTTLLANGDDILLYGGTVSEKVAVMDYCYTLNVPTMTWKYHNLAAPAGVSGPRSHHSAILVNNTSLFIIFGLDKDGKRSNQLSVLDVRDANNITFANTFPFDNPTGNNGDGTKNKDKDGLGAGAIAGIAIGGVIAGALVVLGLVYYSRGKKNKKAGIGSGSTHYEEQKNNESELLEVDWDRIDNHYKEVDLPPATISPTVHQQQQQQQQTYYSQQQYMSDDLYSQAESSTVMSVSQPPHTSATTSPETRFSGVSPNLYESKPDAARVNSPDVVKPSFLMKPVKPDGGF
ncbi:hypothetical protein BD770DRAFT_390342 [Pilaira anomala]|nr:hypothetical protein BD770DRAFT_390342 [Pilaira anomala]